MNESTAFDTVLLSRIEDASLNASAPMQQRWVDGWWVRFSAGKAKRARCVNAVAEGRGDLQHRLRACEQIFRDAGLPMIVRITPFTLPPGLDAMLEAQGMTRFDDTRVMVLQHVSRLASPDRPSPALSVRPLALDDFARLVGGFRGSPLAHCDAHAQRLLTSPLPIHAFELVVDGQPAACGQYTLEGDLVGLYDVFTKEEFRGRGLAGHLCRHLLQTAGQQGAQHAYLQVESDNHAARAVYRRIGFVDGYAYHYRTADPSLA